jgi:glutamine amidotransferase
VKKGAFVVIDYGMGNLRSVRNALSFLGCDVEISSDPDVVESAEALVLPGVGAFGEAMQNLNDRGLVSAIRSASARRTPLLGICLGMQLIAEESEERGLHKGLGLIPGRVRRIPAPAEFRLPHVGWNQIEIVRQEPFLRGVDNGESFYFVHTFALETDDRYAAARCNYGVDFIAAVQHDNIFATQFHPERSQTKGLRLLRNFVTAAQAAAAKVSSC